MYAKYLFEAAAELGAVPQVQAEALGRLLLALPEGRGTGLHFRSTLNNDGSPLQVCITASRRRHSVRFIGDPGAFLGTWARRYERALEALARLILATRAESLTPVCNRLLEGVLPAKLEGLSQEQSAALWLAAGLPDSQMAMYVKARWEDAGADWLRTLTALKRVLPHSEEAESVIHDLRTKAQVVSVGIEGASSEDARIKLYWRLIRPVLLASLPVCLLGEAALADFLTMTVCNRALPSAGLVFSVGFLLATGAVQDVKIDVCAHCLPQPAATWLELIDRLADRYALRPIAIHRFLMTGRAEVALVGLGIDRNIEKRLNVYLKLPSEIRN